MQTKKPFSYGFRVVLYHSIGSDISNYRSKLNVENGNNFSEERTAAFRDKINAVIRAALISGELPVYRTPDLELVEDYNFFAPPTYDGTSYEWRTDEVIMWHDIKTVIEKKLPFQRMPDKPVFSREFQGMEKTRLKIESLNSKLQKKRKALEQTEPPQADDETKLIYSKYEDSIKN